MRCRGGRGLRCRSECGLRCRGGRGLRCRRECGLGCRRGRGLRCRRECGRGSRRESWVFAATSGHNGNGAYHPNEQRCETANLENRRISRLRIISQRRPSVTTPTARYSKIRLCLRRPTNRHTIRILRGGHSLTASRTCCGTTLMCVRQDEGQSIRVYFNDVGKRFIPWPFDVDMWTLGNVEPRFTLDQSQSGFAEELRRTAAGGGLLYGYPMYVEAGRTAIPLFIWPIEYELHDRELWLRTTPIWPQMNPEYLKRLGHTPEEQREILDSLGLLNSTDDPPRHPRHP